MAKKHFKPRTHDSGSVITTKTPYGSTSDMIVDHTKYRYIADNGPVIINENLGGVVCKDDKGFYMTFKNRIDTGMADPNRYGNSFMRIDIHEVEEQNLSSS